MTSNIIIYSNFSVNSFTVEYLWQHLEHFVACVWELTFIISIVSLVCVTLVRVRVRLLYSDHSHHHIQFCLLCCYAALVIFIYAYVFVISLCHIITSSIKNRGRKPPYILTCDRNNFLQFAQPPATCLPLHHKI